MREKTAADRVGGQAVMDGVGNFIIHYPLSPLLTTLGQE